AGGGYVVTLRNDEDEGPVEHGEVFVTCLDPSVTTDNTLVLVHGSAHADANLTVNANVFCGVDTPVPFAGFIDLAGCAAFDLGTAPLWGSAASPRNLGDMSDGTTDSPTGWQAKIRNASNSPVTVGVFGICGKVPAARTFVTSAPTSPSEGFTVYDPV